MVRRGSTVRVRQRALQKPRKSRLFLLKELAEAPVCGGYGALLWSFQVQKTAQNASHFEREAGVSTRLRSSATPIRRWAIGEQNPQALRSHIRNDRCNHGCTPWGPRRSPPSRRAAGGSTSRASKEGCLQARRRP